LSKRANRFVQKSKSICPKEQTLIENRIIKPDEEKQNMCVHTHEKNFLTKKKTFSKKQKQYLTLLDIKEFKHEINFSFLKEIKYLQRLFKWLYFFFKSIRMHETSPPN